MIKRWLVSELFFPDELGTGYYMTEIANKLAEEGPLNVICGPSGYDSDVNISKRTIHENIKIHRVSIPKLDKNKVLFRIVRMILISLKMGAKVLFNVKKEDHLILVTNPASILVIIGLIKRIKGFRYSLIVHDVFPENLVPAEFLKPHSFLYKLFLRVFNWAYNCADRLIPVGEDMKELMIKKVKREIPIDVIQNWAEVDQVYPLDRSAHYAEYYDDSFAQKIVFQFAGNIGRVQGLDSFFNVIAKVRNPDLKFVFIGDGAHKKKLLAIKDKNNMENVHFYPNKPRNEQNVFLNHSDFGIVTLSEGMFGLGIPSKTYNILAAGKPVFYIGDENSEVSLYIKKYHVGFSFLWSEEDKLIAFFESIRYSNRNEYQKMGLTSRKVVEEQFSKNAILNKYMLSLT